MAELKLFSPVTQCRVALGLSSGLQQAAKAYTDNGSKPSGVLTVANGSASGETLERISSAWQSKHGGPERVGRVAVVTGDVKFEPVAFSAADSEFLAQRQYCAVEVARTLRVPAWAIDAPVNSASLTYANVQEQTRALATYSLRPVAVRTALSQDTDLCPSQTFLSFDFDGLLRSSPEQRASMYTAALDPVTGWMQRPEVRALEDSPPETPAALTTSTEVA